MIDTVNFKGHFTIQSIDQNGDIVDEFIEDNMIMESARTSMNEMFAMSNTSTGVDKLMLSTLGHVGESIVTPKGSADGFVKERDRLFGDYTEVIDDATISMMKNSTLKYIGTDNGTATTNNYYIYIGEFLPDILVSTIDFSDTNVWTDYGDTEPYIYEIDFNMPGANGSADNIVETDADSGSTVNVHFIDETTTFTFDLVNAAANGSGTTIFTEASLHANGRIFSMKTFKAKIKENSIILRIIWKIKF